MNHIYKKPVYGFINYNYPFSNEHGTNIKIKGSFHRSNVYYVCDEVNDPWCYYLLTRDEFTIY